MKLKLLVGSLALLGLASHALAQDAVQRVTITGSSIKRIQAEGALPVQVIRFEDIERAGITSAEQLLATISANGNGIDNMTSNQGGDFLNSTLYSGGGSNNGSAAASLRGFGAANTLVLLNGRRISTHGLNGKSVDLNSIPLAAISRVEILKDGASAIYGTEAIGGVINFILKRDYAGLEATAFVDTTQHGGGNVARGSVLFGMGSLAEDRFNVMASVTYDTNSRLRGSQRSFHDGYQPERGLAPDTTGTPFANIAQAGGTAIPSRGVPPGLPVPRAGLDPTTYNRFSLLALQGKCETVADMVAYRGDITGSGNNNTACAYDYGKQWSLMQPVDRLNVVTRGSFALSNEHTAFVELVASKTKSEVEYTPIQITNQNYPVSGPYYQNLAVLLPAFFKDTNTNAADTRVFFDATKPERIRWRCLPCGPRQQTTTTDAMRALVGLEGVLAGWDYKAGLSSAQSKGNTVYGDGNVFQTEIRAAITSGLINPFLLPGQTQTQAGQDAVNASKAKGGALYGGKSTLSQADVTFSGEIAKLPAGPLAMALGADLRKEGFQFNESQSADPRTVLGVTAPSPLDKVSRNIQALIGELNVPIVKGLEAQLALRHDRYSDFGSTTNPKVALRWQPATSVVLRSSFGKGFRAPDFGVLHGGDLVGAFNSDVNDPLTCVAGVGDGCNIRPDIIVRSNPKLKPERSTQWSAGFVVSPADWLSASVDVWQVKISDRISPQSPRYILDNPTLFANKINRDSSGVATEVIMDYFNLATDKATGADINLSAAFKTAWGRFDTTLDGTYFASYKTQLFPGAAFVERVGKFGNQEFGWDLKLRWKHTLGANWSQGDWSVALTQNFSSGYESERDGFGSGIPTPANYPLKVKSYTLYGTSVTYKGIKNLSLTAGIKNLLDTDPSFSGHNVDNVAGAGWDARVGDPRGRAFTLRANYKFF